jgi:chromate transporter
MAEPAASSPKGAEPPLAAPHSPWHLFVAFTLLAMQGFGGVLAVAQQELCVRRRWMTPAEFLAILGTAQVLPGPNVCNLSLMVGDRFFGWRGALAALAGMITLPMIVMLALAWLVGLTPEQGGTHDAVRGALWGIAAVAAGQIVGTVLKLAAPLKDHPLGLSACVLVAAAALAMMTWLRWPLVWVLLCLGLVACGWTYWALRRMHKPTGGARP